MGFLGFIITVLLLFTFMKKLCNELKRLFSKAPRCLSLFIITLFAVCFIGIDFGHQMFHRGNGSHQCQRIINSTSKDTVSTITKQDNLLLKYGQKCPYCGVLLKIAESPTIESLILINNYKTRNIVFNSVFSNIQKLHKQIRAPPFFPISIT